MLSVPPLLSFTRTEKTSFQIVYVGTTESRKRIHIKIAVEIRTTDNVENTTSEIIKTKLNRQGFLVLAYFRSLQKQLFITVSIGNFAYSRVSEFVIGNVQIIQSRIFSTSWYVFTRLVSSILPKSVILNSRC